MKIQFLIFYFIKIIKIYEIKVKNSDNKMFRQLYFQNKNNYHAIVINA